MSDTPRYYSDSFNSVVTPWGVALSFYKSPAPAQIPQAPPGANVPMPPSVPLFDMDMSWQHAKMMVIQLHKSIKQFETDVLKHPIELDPRIIEQNKVDLAKEW